MDHSHGDIAKTQGRLPLPDMIIWDMDGTLLKSNAGRFVTSDNESKARRILETLDNTYRIARNLKDKIVPNFHLSPNAKSKLLSYATKTHDDSLESLEAIQRMGITQAIVSNNSRAAIGNKVLSHFAFREAIDESVFLEDMGGIKKPSVDIMRQLIEKTDMPEDASIWVVGDSTTDVRFAMNADDTLPQVFVPIAMGHFSRAANYLKQHANEIESFAIVSGPSEVAIMAAADPNQYYFDMPPDTNDEFGL